MEEEYKRKKILIGSVLFFSLIILILIVIIWMQIIKIKEEKNKANEEAEKINNKKVEYEEVNKKLNDDDINQIYEYMNKIYSYYEFSIPEFNNINSASSKWLWGVAFNNTERKTEAGYIELKEVAVSLFGEDLINHPSKEDSSYYFMAYNESSNTFTKTERDSEYLFPKYVIESGYKNGNLYYISIYEYILEIREAESNKTIKLKDYDNLLVKEFNYNDESIYESIEKYVLNNKESFNNKQIVLKKVDEKYVVKSSQNI